MGIRQRWKALKPGLAIGPESRNEDFWGITFGRPTAALLLSLVADIPAITPTRLTHLSNLLIVAGSLVLLVPAPWAFIVAAVLLNLSLTVDCADGQLARYRGVVSELGGYYDKISDYFGFTVMFACLAWACYARDNDPVSFILAMATLASMLITGYAKWLETAILYRMGSPPSPPPVATESWSRARVVLTLARRILDFNEPDVFLWVGLALLLDRPKWSLFLLAPTQLFLAFLYSLRRARVIARIEATNRALSAPGARGWGLGGGPAAAPDDQKAQWQPCAGPSQGRGP